MLNTPEDNHLFESCAEACNGERRFSLYWQSTGVVGSARLTDTGLEHAINDLTMRAAYFESRRKACELALEMARTELARRNEERR